MDAAALLASVMPAGTELSVLPGIAGLVIAVGITVSLIFAGFRIVKRVIRASAG